jgi:hypothetical protein
VLPRAGQRRGGTAADKAFGDQTWRKAVHRVVTAGITPEQSADEAIARIKEILKE